MEYTPGYIKGQLFAHGHQAFSQSVACQGITLDTCLLEFVSQWYVHAVFKI